MKPIKTWRGEGPALAAVQAERICADFCICVSNICCKESLTPGFLVLIAGLLWQIGYFVKNLDLNNVDNTCLSGIEEDLEMYGN